MYNVSWQKDMLKINEKKIFFEEEILEVRELEDSVFIVTKPQKEALNNIFGVNKESGLVWKIQSYLEIDNKFSQTPYVGITIISRKLIATDFCGCKFVINPINGKIVSRENSMK